MLLYKHHDPGLALVPTIRDIQDVALLQNIVVTLGAGGGLHALRRLGLSTLALLTLKVESLGAIAHLDAAQDDEVWSLGERLLELPLVGQATGHLPGEIDDWLIPR